MFRAVFVISDRSLSTTKISKTRFRMMLQINFVLISKINKSSNYVPGFCCSCENGRSSHLCESSQSPKTPTHVLCFFFTASEHVSTDLWNLQYSLFQLYYLYIQNLGFMFKNIIQNPWAFLRSKSIIDVCNSLPKYKYLAPMVIFLFGWFFASLKHMAETFENSLFSISGASLAKSLASVASK